MKRADRLGWTVLGGVTVAGAAFLAGHALAGGIPATGALTYSGTLEDAAGTPLAGSHNLQVNFWTAAAGGATPACQTGPSATALDNGRFTVTLPDTCTTAVQGNPNVWAEVLVDGASLGRTKISAVPYAVEADHAATAGSASGTLDTRISGLETRAQIPSGLIGMFATSCPVGWSACNGTGTCPNLNGAYVKGGTAFVAQTGSNTHTHAVPASTSGAGGAHTPTPTGVFTTSSNGLHHHAAEFNWDGANLWGHFVGTPSWNATDRISVSGATADARADSAGMVTTDDGAHTHTVTVTMNPVVDHTHSIAAFTVPAANHEPLHATLVFCIKN